MTREEVVRLAKEAGLSPPQEIVVNHYWTAELADLERFADLLGKFVSDRMIANGWRQCAQGQRTTQFCGQLESAVAGEREACAKVAEALLRPYANHGVPAVIRARGNE